MITKNKYLSVIEFIKWILISNFIMSIKELYIFIIIKYRDILKLFGSRRSHSIYHLPYFITMRVFIVMEKFVAIFRLFTINELVNFFYLLNR